MGVVDWHSAEFWDRFRRGDVAVLESIYWAFVDVVEHVLAAGFVTKDRQNVVPGVRDPDRRGDLVQDVFVKAFSESARKSFDATLEYRPYLLTVTRNVLVDHHRRHSRDKVVHEPAPESQAPPPALDPDGPSWTEPALVQVVERYVRALASPLRELHQARFVDGRSQRKAALMLGLSRQSVRTLEARLKDGLRQALQEAWRAESAVRAALDGTDHVLRPASVRGK